MASFSQINDVSIQNKHLWDILTVKVSFQGHLQQIQCNPYLFIYNLKVFWTYLKELKIVGLKSCNLILNKLVHYASIWVFLRFSSRILKFIWASQQLSHQAVFCVFLKPANCLLKIKKNEGQLLIIVYSLKRIVNDFQIIFKTR